MRGVSRAALLLVLTAAIYAPTLGYGTVYEDSNDTATSLRAHPLSDLWQKPARSLTDLSFTLTHAVSVQPWADHLGNLALHLVNVALVYALLRIFCSGELALWMALLFAVHPINAEAVAYISSRGELLSTTFILLALCAVSLGYVALALLAVCGAVLGKETAVCGAALVALWAYWMDAPVNWRAWRWSLAPAILVALWLAWGRGQNLVVSFVNIGTQLTQTGALLSRVIWPFGLTIDHDWLWIQPWMALIVLGVVILITMTALSVGVPLRSPWALAWLWCLVAVSPRLVVRLYEGQHEHHVYLLAVGLCLSAGMAFGLHAPQRNYSYGC